VLLDRDGEPVSTLDLFGRKFVLLATGDGDGWRAAALAAAGALGLPLDAYVVGGDELVDPEGGFAEAYGLSGAGAVLVRPDGIVAWRTVEGDAASEATVHDALSTVLCR
jgi:hypothetical protein